MRRRVHGFTLLEILIVVVILGILAAVVVPQFFNSTQDARRTSTYHETKRLRKAVEVYLIRHEVLPDVAAGNMTWNSLITSGDYLKSAPLNSWIGGANAGEIVIGNAPDNTYHTNYGWIYDDTTGQVWAAGFDSDDNPHPKP